MSSPTPSIVTMMMTMNSPGSLMFRRQGTEDPSMRVLCLYIRMKELTGWEHKYQIIDAHLLWSLTVKRRKMSRPNFWTDIPIRDMNGMRCHRKFKRSSLIRTRSWWYRIFHHIIRAGCLFNRLTIQLQISTTLKAKTTISLPVIVTDSSCLTVVWSLSS